MVNFGPLKAEIGWQFWGTPGNFNGFRILTSLLHQRRSKGGQPNFARCFFISWAGTQYLHFGGLVPPNRILPGAKFTLCQSCVLLYWQHYCMALEQWASTEFYSVVQGRELGNFRSSFAPPIFSRAAIALGIVPHSSLICITN